jgi:glyoxylase-like metal-dependent hydrolase (beta-lactamase superfamily II)
VKILSLFAAALFVANTAFAAEKSGLTLDVYNANASSFYVNSTLVYGETEALLVDTGFTKADALRIAAKVLDSGKQLKTIFISQADPDYYFGAEVLHKLFPEAQIITTAAVKKLIEKNVSVKLDFWGPKMGANAPVKPVIPAAYSKHELTVDGYSVEIHGTEGKLAHRPYLWIPENKAILGNVAIFGNLHLWMADTQTAESQRAWTAQLAEMRALQPEVVIPGHMKAGTALNTETISYSQHYLTDFKAAKQASSNSKELIEKMTSTYPDAGLSIALGIGAKVHKGEMKW